VLYIGWNDYHNPRQLAEYYTSVVNGSSVDQSHAPVRLFMIPGMNHCAGGAGCDTFYKLGAIDSWVTQGKAPERIVASKVVDGKVVRSRPQCAYPRWPATWEEAM
jgi:feruloyl esterase